MIEWPPHKASLMIGRLAAVLVALLLLGCAGTASGAGMADSDFDEMLGDTCEPRDLRPELHKSWLMYCRGEERKAYDKMRALAAFVPQRIWSDCAASVVKPKGSSLIEFTNCLNRILDNMPIPPPNSAVLSRGLREERFWTLKECQDAQKSGGGVCIVK